MSKRTFFVSVLVVAVGAFVTMALPDIKRYMKIRDM